jgi:hypothetical protein
MPFIYHNPTTDQVLDHDPQDSAYTAWSVSEEYAQRLLQGERPSYSNPNDPLKSWDMLLLPDRPKFHKMASGSELWAHISTYTPGLASLLYTALTTSTAFDNTAVMTDIKNMMRGIVAQLGTDHALHSTPSSVIINDPTDPEGLPIPDATMADHLDQMLSECWFGFSYADLMTP